MKVLQVLAFLANFCPFFSQHTSIYRVKGLLKLKQANSSSRRSCANAFIIVSFTLTPGYRLLLAFWTLPHEYLFFRGNGNIGSRKSCRIAKWFLSPLWVSKIVEFPYIWISICFWLFEWDACEQATGCSFLLSLHNRRLFSRARFLILTFYLFTLLLDVKYLTLTCNKRYVFLPFGE